VDIAFLWLSTTPAATTKIKMIAEDRKLETRQLLKAQAPLLRQMVMKNGELFEGDTLNQVWPEPLWFWNYDHSKTGAPLNYGKTVQP
jgi:hypothetical protein